MDHKDLLFRMLEGLYENSPWLFWSVLGVLCGLIFLLWVCGVVAEAIARLKRQQLQEPKANHRLLLWMWFGGFILLYVAMFPVMLVIGIVFFLWEDFKAARQVLLESSETIRQARGT